MKITTPWALVALVSTVGLVGSVGVSRSAAQPQAAVEADIRQALEDYVGHFSAKRADLIADQSVMAPSTTISATAVTTALTPADVKRRYEANLNGLAAQRYERSRVKNATVCLLNDAAAIVSGQFTRYRTDGSVLSEIASTYVFAKSDGRWRIVNQISHGTDRRISCGA